MKKKRIALCLCCLLIVCTLIMINVIRTSATKTTTIKTTKITLANGEKKQIVIDNKREGEELSFQCNNTSLATVDKEGIISGKEAGTAEVTVMETIKSNEKKLGTVEVKVVAKESNAKLKTIQSDLKDTNYDVPNDFWTKKSDVKYGEVKDIQYNSTATKTTRNAKVILPAGYTTEKKYPVLYLIHGIGGDENTLYNDNVNDVIGNAIASGAAEKMIVVLPNACANATGKPPKDASGKDMFFSLEHYQAYDNFLNDFKDCLMPYINKNFSAATGRENTAIAGFSMGGRVALHIGFSMTDSIRYIGGFCPAFGILEYSNNGVHENGLFTEKSFTLPEKYMNDTLVLIAAGKNDSVVRDEPKRYHNALTTNSVPHIFYETMGGVNNTGSGEHGGDVYKHGLYNFMRRIFHN